MAKFCGMDYDVFGEGSPVLLLHGWGANKDCWGRVDKSLSLKYKVYKITFWGFKNSDLPPNRANIFDYANVVSSFIKEVIKEPVVLIGHSFGGRIALILGKSDYVSKILIFDGAGLKPRFNLKKYYLQKKYQRLRSKVSKGKLDSAKLLNYGSTDYRNLDGVMKKVFVNVINTDLSDYAKAITLPTLLVWGRFDKETPLYMAHKLNRCIKNSTLKIVNGGHFSYLDDDSECIKYCFKFIEGEKL